MFKYIYIIFKNFLFPTQMMQQQIIFCKLVCALVNHFDLLHWNFVHLKRVENNLWFFFSSFFYEVISRICNEIIAIMKSLFFPVAKSTQTISNTFSYQNAINFNFPPTTNYQLQFLIMPNNFMDF